jgi:hypothetical protein
MRALLLAAAVLLSACYNYVPVTAPTAPTGVRASILLTDQGTVDLARELGPSTKVIEGEIVNGSENAMVLAVRRVERRSGIEEFWKGENVTVPRAAVAQFSQRRFSRSRTAFASVGIAALLFGLSEAFGATEILSGRGSRGPVTER